MPPRARACALLVLAACLPLPAQEPESAPPANTNFVLKTITNGVFEIGRVRLDQQRRAVTLPAFVNLRDGALEYLLVTSNGKTHESLLRTDAEPYHIHVAMLLLGARTAGTNALSEAPADSISGERILVEVAWKKKSKQFRARAETFDFFFQATSTMTLSPGIESAGASGRAFVPAVRAPRSSMAT